MDDHIMDIDQVQLTEKGVYSFGNMTVLNSLHDSYVALFSIFESLEYLYQCVRPKDLYLLVPITNLL